MQASCFSEVEEISAPPSCSSPTEQDVVGLAPILPIGEQMEGKIDAIVLAPVVDSVEYNGPIRYESPRIQGAYNGSIKASLKGVEGRYTAHDREKMNALDSYVQRGEERGNLVPAHEQAVVIGDGSPGFTARRASEIRSSGRLRGGSVEIDFNAFSLDVTYSQQPASYWRYLFADAEIPMHRTFRGTFRERSTLVSQTPNVNGRAFVAAAHDGKRLAESEERALWFAVNFLCGTKSGNYLLEGFDATGGLVSREFRAGHDPQPAVLALFNVYVMPPSDFVDVFANGFYRAQSDGFPIDVILEQLFDSAESVLDFKLQNCLLAVHAAFEAWHKLRPPDVRAAKSWLSKNKSTIFQAIDELVETAPELVKDAIERGINGAATFGTGDKERRFFSDWSIPVDGVDEKKALALRNGLLHDGYFNSRFEDIGPDEQQFRVNALGTLKNVVALILFRAIGYMGKFMSQRDFFTHLTAVQREAVFQQSTGAVSLDPPP